MSNLVPFHSGKIRNFYFNTCPGTSLDKFKTQYFIVGNSYELTLCRKQCGSSGSTLFSLVYVWFHTVF